MSVRVTLLVLALLAVGRQGEPVATPDEGVAGRSEPVTQGMVDLDDGRQLYINCRGETTPTVIIETGLGDPGITWGRVFPEIAEFARVCIYARAGVGGSDAPPEIDRPRTVIDVVGDLEMLLRNAHIEPPYVLVGQSLGGVNARAFAARHLDDVVGMVLVDSSHEQQVEISSTFASPVMKKLEAAYESDKANIPTYEGIDLKEYVPKGTLPPRLGEMPLVVLTATKTPSYPPPEQLPEAMRAVFEAYPDEMEDAMERALEMMIHMQQDLSYLSTHGRQIMVEDAGHMIHVDQPQAVIDAIREVVETARSHP
ncbi:MAG: alpha/beta hydrolase [Acidobacteriota bacterium]|nr:alpha/beta hydrolase [Acidobacteriota bacterium]